MSSLEKKLTELIAKDLGISPDEVTPEFIHTWRENHLYNNVQYGFNTRFGGFNAPNRTTRTRPELKAQSKANETFLDQFLQEEEEE